MLNVNVPRSGSLPNALWREGQKRPGLRIAEDGFRYYSGATEFIVRLLFHFAGHWVFTGWVLMCVAAAADAALPGAGPELSITRPQHPAERPRLRSSPISNSVVSLEASTNWVQWETIATLHDLARHYPDFANGRDSARFFRMQVAPRSVTNDWKNEITYPEEPFLSASGQLIDWVKFVIPLGEFPRVHYQDSGRFPFHYDFAATRLKPFIGLGPADFDRLTLYRNGQQAVLGAVLFPRSDPGATAVEYGVEFVGQDVYTPDEISAWFELVRATVYATNGAGVFYVPTFEQSEMARTNAAAFAQRNVPVSSLDRWVLVNHVYSSGWAVGRLKFFPGSDIAAAFADGRLNPSDILLTDGVPAETPLVAGIITLAPSGPNSHTALLARSFGIPFVHIPETSDQARISGLVGRRVVLRATSIYSETLVKVLDVEDALTPALEAGLLGLKVPPPIQFQPKEVYGAISASTDALVPSDIRFFGGKAANYSLLRKWVPDESPPAIALSFDLWEAFLDQPLPGGGILRDEIAVRLAPYTNYPPDIPALKQTLQSIRSLITSVAVFTAAQKQAVIDALAVFNPNRRMRFRSSTNVEDSEHFTGAGLYDSYSGCLLDDLDGDASGPSLCDPGEAEERGVFRAIQKVYGSFYNDNAFLERLRHGVDESEVGMAVLVHHSFPDDEELANGVATLEFTFAGYTNVTGEIVSQVGAESVTNPDGTSQPEEVSVYRFNESSFFSLTRRSSRVPLGAFVMDWGEDYRGFIELFTTLGFGFKDFYPAKQGFHLDFEFKKDVNLGLVVKQVREIPTPSTTNQVTAFLLDEPASYTVRQGEFGTVFGNHRLKSLWTLSTTNFQMTPGNLARGVYTTGSLEYVGEGLRQVLEGPLASWPNASNSALGRVTHWTTGAASDQWLWQLDTALTPVVTGSEPPVFTQLDFSRTVTVDYPEALPTVDYTGMAETTMSETIALEKPQEVTAGALLQNRSLGSGNVEIDSTFYWPKPIGFAAGYTAPLVRFVETRIAGLTTEPIVLTNYYSQTYRPGHHNFTEEFIFEPRLEPGLPAQTLAELNAANIQLLYVLRDFGPTNTVRILGLDRVFRGL